MLTTEQAKAATTGKLRADCERLANNDDEMAELIARGYDLRWGGARLSLYKDGRATHGPDKRQPHEDSSPFGPDDWNRRVLDPCPRCHGWGGLVFDQTGGMAQGCPDCDETGERLRP